MSDDTTRDEYQLDRLLDTEDQADWRAARGLEPERRPTRDEMIAHFARERVEYERTRLADIATDAVIAQWRRDRDARATPTLEVHAVLRLTGCGDPTPDELRAQLQGVANFDTIDIEAVA